MLPPEFMIDLLSRNPPRCGTLFLGAVRVAGAMLMLPMLAVIPWRLRIAIAGVVGGSLATLSPEVEVDVSIAAFLSELMIGISFGIGFRWTLSALHAAGTWIDEHTGTGLSAEAALIEPEESTSGSVQILVWAGAWLLLTSRTMGVEVAMLHRLNDSWTTLPLGSSISPTDIPTWLVDTLQTWSELALGVALPLFLLMGMIQGAVSLMGRGLGVHLGPTISPLRGGLTLLLFWIVLPLQADRIERADWNDQHGLTIVDPAMEEVVSPTTAHIIPSGPHP